jgi:imidazolonepropionase-like amidohydrolase
MKRGARLAILLAFSALFVSELPAAEEPGGLIALRGATIHTAVGPPIPGGVILIRGGKIAAVGKDVAIPAGALIIDVAGKEIIPGLIDEHSHIGVYYRGANEFPQPIGPENLAIDNLTLVHPEWREALKGGVTAVVTGPGSGERMGGQSVTIKTFEQSPAPRILKETREAKMALNARNLSHFPSIRKTLLKAKEYRESWERYEAGGRTGPAPDRDPAMESLVPVLKGEEKVRCHLHYASDMMAFLRLKDEFGIDLTFIHTSEAYKIAPEIAKRNVPVIGLPLYTRIAVSDDMLFGVRALYEAGVKVCLHTDHPVIHEKLMRNNAGLVIRYGVPEEAALQMVTLNPAVSSKVAGRIGSLEPGKDADLVVLDGTWFEPRTRVDMVFVDGVLAYDRVREEGRAKEVS